MYGELRRKNAPLFGFKALCLPKCQIDFDTNCFSRQFVLMHRKVTIYKTSKMAKNIDILLMIHIHKLIKGKILALKVKFINVFEFGLIKFLS